MDFFEFNKIAGGLLASLLLYMLVTTFADSIYEAEAPETPAYYVALPEQEAAEATEAEEAAAEPAGPTLDSLLADASVSQGQRAFAKCQACHAIEAGASHKIGPNLHNVVGAEVARHPDFNYSSALTEHGGRWDYEALSTYLEDPRNAIPGNKMAFAGVKDLEDRANLIAFLRSNTENPPPLPGAGEEAAATEDDVEDGGL